ncbi:MAG TPA: hypothetical protein V6D19_02250 [Stenomitos sp.]
MGLQDIRRDRRRFNRLNYRIRLLLLLLSTLLILVSIVLAAIIFSYVLDIATHPLRAKELVDQWSAMFLEPTLSPPSPDRSATAFDGPARWFAVITLVVLAYLLTRIPVLMLQMGTQLLLSCQDDDRALRGFVREVLEELRSPELDNPPPKDLP